MILCFTSITLKKHIFRPYHALNKTDYYLVRINFKRYLNFRSMCSNNSDSDIFKNLKKDRFGGITISSENEPNEDEATFRSMLLKSLSKWNEEGMRAVWFHVSRSYSRWLPVLSENSFLFHHVSHDGETVVMYRWLPQNKPSSVPPYAHTMVGVGGIVLNSRGELLVVLQRFGTREILKLPGGYVEPQEDLSEAAIREVEEETGIKTKFVSCISFRHTHCANFNCSDLYFLLHLEPLNTITNDESDEVVEVKWISIDDFLIHPKVHDLNKLFIKTFLDNKKNKISMVKNDGLHPVTKQPYSFYHVTGDSSDH